MNRKLFTFVVVLFMIATLPNSAAFAATRTTLPGSAPAWANSAHFTAAADPDGVVGFRVYLGWNNSAAAEAFAQAVSDPKSATYGQYPTAWQFRQKFAPGQTSVGAVK